MRYQIEKTTLEKGRQILRIALPLVVQGLVFQLQSLTDKAFLGNIDTRYVSAIGASQMPYSATSDSLIAVSIGLVIIVSRFWGAGDKKSGAAHVKSAMFFSSFISIAVFFLWQLKVEAILVLFHVDSAIIGYSINYIKIISFYMLFLGVDSSLQAMLQGIGETRPIMFAGILKVFLNIAISWVLIFGKFGFPALYVNGAAIGILVANLVSFLYIICYCVLLRGKEYLGRFKSLEWFQVHSYAKVIRLGIPVGMEYLLWSVSNLVLVRFVNSFSYQDLAIYTLTFGFQCIVYVIFESNSKATMTLISQSIGEGRNDKIDGYFYSALVINIGIVALAAVTFALFPGKLLQIFSNDNEVIQNGAIYLVCMGAIMFPQSINIICGNAIRAHGDTKWMLYSQILGSILVVSISWILIEIAGMGMLAIYITLFMDESIRGGINYIYYRRKFHSKESNEFIKREEKG